MRSRHCGFGSVHASVQSETIAATASPNLVLISDCTDSWTEPKPPWRARKESYLSALPGKPAQSLLVSLADKTHNAEAILFDYRVLGDALWDRFNGGADGTRWYYSALADVFSDAMPGRLSDRLMRAVAAFSD